MACEQVAHGGWDGQTQGKASMTWVPSQDLAKSALELASLGSGPCRLAVLEMLLQPAANCVGRIDLRATGVVAELGRMLRAKAGLSVPETVLILRLLVRACVDRDNAQQVNPGQNSQSLLSLTKPRVSCPAQPRNS